MPNRWSSKQENQDLYPFSYSSFRQHTMDRMFCDSPLLYDLPLEILLKVASHLEFADLWYLGTCSRRCQTTVQKLVWHKYRIDLTRPHIHMFGLLIHSAVAFVERHGYCDAEKTIVNYPTLQSVANRLAVEIYDRTPNSNWQPSLDFLLDRMLGIMMDHVLLDPVHDPPVNSTLGDFCTERELHKYNSTKTASLITELLATLYPTLTALFDSDPAKAIHHRLLLAHLSRHLDGLTHRYHQHHRCRLLLPSSAPQTSVQRSFRVLIQFIGSLCQTDLMTAADLHLLSRQRIIGFFLSQQAPPQSTLATFNTDIQNNTSTVTAIQYYQWRLWVEEVEFKMAVLLDLLRAVVCRQYTRWDSGKELQMIASFLNETVSTMVSCKSYLTATGGPNIPDVSATDAVLPTVSPSR